MIIICKNGLTLKNMTKNSIRLLCVCVRMREWNPVKHDLNASLSKSLASSPPQEPLDIEMPLSPY